MSQLLGKRKYDRADRADRSVFSKRDEALQQLQTEDDVGEFVLPPKEELKEIKVPEIKPLTKAEIFKLQTGTLNLNRDMMQEKRLQMKNDELNRLHAALTKTPEVKTAKDSALVIGEEVPTWHKGNVIWTFNTDYGIMCRALKSTGSTVKTNRVKTVDDGGYGSDDENDNENENGSRFAVKDNWRSIHFTLNPGQIFDYERLKIADDDKTDLNSTTSENHFFMELKKILWIHWIKIESVIAKNIGMESLWQKHLRATDKEQQETTGALLAYRVSDLARVGCTTESITNWMIKQVKQSHTESKSATLVQPLRPLRSYERFAYSGDSLVVERVQYETYLRVTELMKFDRIDPALVEQEDKDQESGALTEEKQWEKDILNTRYSKRTDTSAKINSQRIILDIRNKNLRKAIDKQLSFITTMTEDEAEKAKIELLIKESAMVSGVIPTSSSSDHYGGKQLHRTGPPPSNYVCHRCSVPGHWIEVCPQRNKDKVNHSNGKVDISAYGEVKSKLVERWATGFLRSDLRLASAHDIECANNGEVVIYYLPKSSDEKIPQDFQRYVLKEGKRKQLETSGHKTTFASQLSADKFEMKQPILTPDIIKRASAVVLDPRYNLHLRDDDYVEDYVPPDYFENARKLSSSISSFCTCINCTIDDQIVEVKSR